MIMIGLIAIAAIILATLFRTLALGSTAQKLTNTRIWEFDIGTRYGWMAFGLAIILIAFYQSASISTLLSLTVIWLVGLAIIWFLPPYLARFL